MSDIRLVYDWLNHSHNNIIVACHCYNDLYPKQTEIACYLSHQCAVILAQKAYDFCVLKLPDNKTTFLH